ncbi:MAG TPA: type II toxin-antitoxin system VapC family toxin [Pyrinomonadaceae bacterium]|nr:type II toxin-antitoxin system VapC family toxin [Pyrinomonadaceae bacterium]
MSVFFCDTSGLVKRYVAETGSTWLTSQIDPANGSRIYIAQITIVEVVSAITRKERGNHLSANDAATALQTFEINCLFEFSIVPFSMILVNESVSLAKKYALRGYDAVQLASALQTQIKRTNAGLSPLTLLSADTDLNAAAISEGLTVDNPNNH